MTRRGTVNNPPKPEEIIATYYGKDIPSPFEIEKKHGYGCVLFRSSVPVSEHKPQSPTQDELAAEAFNRPATEQCILAHLLRASALGLRLNGCEKDSDGTQAFFILTDYAKRLVAEKAREIDIFLALEHFIEHDEKGFFPTFAALLKRVKKGG